MSQEEPARPPPIGTGSGPRVAEDGPDIQLQRALSVPVSDLPPEPPIECNVPWYAILIKAIISSIAYVPFASAVLFHTVRTGVAIDTLQWETLLGRADWVAAMVLFVSVLAYPLVMTYGGKATPADQMLFNQWRIPFMVLIFINQCLTLFYASKKPQLCVVRHPSTRYPMTACGGQRESRIDFTQWRNWFEMVSIVLELFQFLSLAFSSSAWTHWFDSSSTNFTLFVLEFPEEWVGFSIGIFFVGVYVLLLGFVIALNIQQGHPSAAFVYKILPGALFVTVCNRLTSSPDLVRQRWAVIMCFYALFFYGATAPFVASYQDGKRVSKADIFYMPRFQVLDRTLKFVICCVVINTSEAGQFLTGDDDDTVAAKMAVVAVLISVIGTVLVLWQPASIYGIGYIRTATLFMSVWCLITTCTLYWADGGSYRTNNAIWAMLGCGWLVIIGVVTATWLCRRDHLEDLYARTAQGARSVA